MVMINFIAIFIMVYFFFTSHVAGHAVSLNYNNDKYIKNYAPK